VVDIIVNCGVTKRNPVSETPEITKKPGPKLWILSLTVESKKSG
jgi:hypothetical protein